MLIRVTSGTHGILNVHTHVAGVPSACALWTCTFARSWSSPAGNRTVVHETKMSVYTYSSTATRVGVSIGKNNTAIIQRNREECEGNTALVVASGVISFSVQGTI